MKKTKGRKSRDTVPLKICNSGMFSPESNKFLVNWWSTLLATLITGGVIDNTEIFHSHSHFCGVIDTAEIVSMVSLTLLKFNDKFYG
jgi:hypothetical protein